MASASSPPAETPNTAVPQRLIGRPVYTDDHRGRDVGCLQEPAPLRDQLTVTGEHDCLGWIRRDVHCDLPTTVVLERLGDELSRYRVGMHRFRRWLRDCLHRRLFGHLGEHHFRRAVAEFVEHYHRERNNQGLDNRLIAGTPATDMASRVRRRPRLGGLLNFYAWAV